MVAPPFGSSLGDRLPFGGDYNPEQWPRETWDEDVRLMQEAGVTMATVGVFAWAWLEPSEGTYDFANLDIVLDLLHAGGIAVDLATATASPPPWLSLRYPEILPVDRDGNRLWPGSRQTFCPSSPIVRERQLALVEQLAKRYGGHPSLALWHVGNELGCHNAHCYCDVSAGAFRGWLRDRYASVDALNDAWGTAFWSQRYSEWAEVFPPRRTASFANPTQQLDFARFSSDELVASLVAERDILHTLTPGVAVTTNLMLPGFKPVDGFDLGRACDLVSNDHYLRGELQDSHIDLSLGADMTRGIARGNPWLLMEHSTSAVNWQPRNLAKAPGELRRNSLTHVARGSDGALFFQWRASAAGAEKFHSALLPHAGTDTRIWRESVELGANLAAIKEIRGSRVESSIAIVIDWNAWWASELDAHPSGDVHYLDAVRDVHAALWRLGRTADLVHPSDDLSSYALVILPTLYVVADETIEQVGRYVAGGGRAIVTYFSGIADPDDHIRLGGYPGGFADLLGVRMEEFSPLPARATVSLSDGSTASVWTERGRVTTATALATFADGPAAGSPALTRNSVGDGIAWYVATRLDAEAWDRLLASVVDEAGVGPVVPDAPAGLEAVRRRDAEGSSWVFLLNHRSDAVTVTANGRDLLTGTAVNGSITVPAGGVAVVREHA
jgi:beta-galactosidase